MIYSLKLPSDSISPSATQSSSKSTVLSYWMVGVTLWINFKKTKSENSTLGFPPFSKIVLIMFFIAFAWLQG